MNEVLKNIDYSKPIQAVRGEVTYILMPRCKEGTYIIIGYDWFSTTDWLWNSTRCWEKQEDAVEAYSHMGVSNIDPSTLKAEEPQEPEHLELEILRGMPRNEGASMREKTVGVNTINPSFYMLDNAYNLIGYRYAESDVITCTGPNAWWYGANNRLAVPKSNGYTGNYIPHPVFATHAVYEKVKK